ncbi:hypothetical protein ATY41_09300 [Leifsonia xyli subsp. xyli]|uniref:IPT/TIG domain-containing protein n=1 Tax=Leifsonia xyli subsp. xyli TaxID=59736 RepID=A0A1E2SL81_LEIXY|nr:isopeptide-forming domain-containing fimbrial protein [Leifsonia xyli]ODA90616.1 hypothetical protein ATY41_09300 [Leifsonia xyli subsp. xyli]
MRRWAAVAAATAAALFGAGLVVAPAAVAAGSSLTIEKIVGAGKALTVANGSEFTYSIAIGCDDHDCVDAAVTDTLPAEFAGFTIRGVAVVPSAGSYRQSLSGCTTQVTAACAVSVRFTQPVAGGVGLAAGKSFTVTVTLKAPQELTPGWPSNGRAVTNTAIGTSSSIAASVSSSAEVTVDIPASVAIAVGKTWTPAEQQHRPGEVSAIALSAQNTSNVPAGTLVLQEPQAAADGAGALEAANPFALVDFAGFGDITLPQGATTVRVDAYVRAAGTGEWSWQTGVQTAAGSVQLPPGVAEAEVAGLRIAFAGEDGAALAPGGSAGSVAQRATDRVSGAGLVGGARVTNRIEGTVSVAGQAPETATATAPFAIGALNIAVTPGKTIVPARIPAGGMALVTVSGKNASNGPLDTLRLSDLGYFGDKLAFDGFAAGVPYPQGATSGSIVWHFSDGSTESAPFPDGAVPGLPTVPEGQRITGLEAVFAGEIVAGAVASASFRIAPSADFAPQGAPASAANTLTVTGTNAAGSATRTASAPLTVFFPDIKLTLGKSIAPSVPVGPGGTVSVQLPATTSSDSAFVDPTRIVIEDVWRPGVPGDFFNAFDPLAIAPTQVLFGSTLLVEHTADGSTWTTLDEVDATAEAALYRAERLPDGVVGLRFTFEDAAGFPQGTTVRPAITAQARPALRDGSGSTSTADAGAETYTNRAVASTIGAVAGKTVTGARVSAEAEAKIRSAAAPATGPGAGGLGIGKTWTKPDLSGDVSSLPSQSGEQAGTRLGWGVTETGFGSVTVADPATEPGHPESTVFQAFDLVKVSPLPFSSDPLLRWDTIASVELFRGGAWVAVPPPPGGWKDAAGFPGYMLSAAESSDTTGLRLRFEPDDAARRVADDPAAPPAGSGIATVAGRPPPSVGLRAVGRLDREPGDGDRRPERRRSGACDRHGQHRGGRPAARGEPDEDE